MLGFLPWSKPKSLECPYCVPTSPLINNSSSSSSLKSKRLACQTCDACFDVREDDELEPVVPILAGEATPGRRTCIPLEQGRMQFGDEILCRTCQHHQNILIQLLSVYESPAGMDKNNEEQEAARIRQYREDLEQRYPLCTTCQSRVQERLRVIEYKVRTKRLAARSSKMEKPKRTTPITRFKNLLLTTDIIIVQGLFSMIAVSEYFKVDTSTIPFFDFFAQNFVWYLLVIPPVFLSIGTNIYNPLKCCWTLFLLFLRVSLINLISLNSVLDSKVSPPPYVMLSIACYGLLWLLYSSTSSRPIQSFKAATLMMTNNSEKRKEKPTSLIDRDDLTKLGSRASTGSSLPFSVSHLHGSRSTNSSSPFGHNIRPSVFDGARKNGLESVLEGFSIDEGTSKRPAKPSLHTNSSFDQMVVAAGFVLARVALDQQLALIALLLVVALGLRNVIWPRLGGTTRFVINTVALLRLTWLVMLFKHDVLPDLEWVHQRSMQLEYIADMLIILSR